MKKFISYGLTIILLLAIVLLYGFSYHRNSHEKIQSITISFVEDSPAFITEKEVNNLLKQSSESPLNKAKSEINLFQLENGLKQHDMIENAEVFLMPNASIQVQVVQRVPVVRVVNGTSSYYLDRQCKEMPLSDNYSARVPIAMDIYGDKQEKECFELIQKIEQDAFYKKQIIGLKRKTNGDYLLNTRVGKHKVLFGKVEHVEEKLRKLKVFYKKQWGSKELKEYQLINLIYKNQVVCSR